MEKDLAVLYAKPGDEPDRAKVKWPKVTYVRPRGKTRFRRKRPYHPGTEKAREILNAIGRSLTTCEDCGAEGITCQVHHKDRNPHNNHPSNLLVLCNYCHATRHHIADFEGVKPWYYGTIRVEEL